MSDLRPCLVRCEDRDPETVDKNDAVFIVKNDLVYAKGVFHRFSDDTCFANDIRVPRTYALVEFLDGHLESCDPDKVLFLDKKAAQVFSVAA